jgi:hypothetical protein
MIGRKGRWALRIPSRTQILSSFTCLFLVVVTNLSFGAELKNETLRTWDNYIRASIVRMKDRIGPNGQFLWVDKVPQRDHQLRAEEILIAPVGEQVPKHVASGLIHDWIGVEFIPGAKLDDVFDVVRDYDHYKMFYKENVVDSKTLSADHMADRFSMLLTDKGIAVSTALAGEYEACFLQLTHNQWYSITYTTRVQEIRNYGHPDEHMLPPGQGAGFIWRIYNLGRLEERDGGVYLEQETIVLSRDVPAALRWLIEPVIRRTSKNALMTSLQQTRAAVRSRIGVGSALAPRVTESTCTSGTPPGS